MREELLTHGIRPLIPPKANRKNPLACDFRAYKDRNRIERMLNRLKQFRRVATRYEKTRQQNLISSTISSPLRSTLPP
uniref:transposase n=1 Tax=Rhizobium subbaraonis TaxID=908946 RepID=UPI001FE06716|nr:transposase [Rhizobium subbaraonis]